MLSLIHEHLTYDPIKGEFFTKRTTKNKPIKIIPDQKGFIKFSNEGIRFNHKASRVAWFITHGSDIPSGYRLLHRDLDESNFKLSNLIIVQVPVFKMIKEALWNLNGGMQLKPHKDDGYVYVLTYKLNGKSKRETVHDIGVAKMKQQWLQLRFAKSVARYVISN